jgi:hypothetical protein
MTIEELGATILVMFTLPFAAAASVGGVFVFLGNFRALNDGVRDWLIKKKPEDTLRRQYALIRTRLYGNSVLSRQRSMFVLSVMLALLLIILLLRLVLSPPVDGTSSLNAHVFLAVNMFGEGIASRPFSTAALIATVFLLNHLTIFIFDYFTLRLGSFTNSLLAYLALLLVGYLICMPLMWVFGGICYNLMMTRPDNIQEVFQNFVNPYSVVYEMLFGLDDEDEGFVVAIIVGSGSLMIGMGAFCLLGMVTMTVINLLHASALGILRVDYILRKKLGWDDRKVRAEPMQYIAKVVGIIVFIAVFAVNSALVGLQAAI